MAEDETKKIDLENLEQEVEGAVEDKEGSDAEKAAQEQFKSIKEIEKSLAGESAEKPAEPEQQEQAEQAAEKEDADKEGKDTEELKVSGPAQSAPAPDKEEASRARQKQIEKVLEQELGDLYMELPQEKRREFKAKGEETARKINVLIEQGKAKVGRIVGLIKQWLSFLPGVKDPFVEQEAKKKADKIMQMNQDDNQEIKVL